MTFFQTESRVVTADSPTSVWYWCLGCERKAKLHEKAQYTLHLDLLDAGESLTVPKGKQHYDGTWDKCDVEERLLTAGTLPKGTQDE